jgi:long-chain fatty acid transport protein
MAKETDWLRRSAGEISKFLVIGGGLAALVGTTSPRTANASPLLETTGAAMSDNPFTARVLPSGAAATYFNPALLLGQSSVGFGTFLVIQNLDIRLQPRPRGVDVEESIYDARVPNPDGTTSRLPIRPLPTSALRNTRGSADPDHASLFLIGGVVVEPIPDTLAVGVLAVVPTHAFQTQTAAFVDEREQYFSNSLRFERFGENYDTNVVTFALGVRPIDWASVGLGLTMTTQGEADNEIFVPDASDQGDMYVNTNVRVRTQFRPHVGLAIEPWRDLRITGTLHLASHNDVSGNNDLQLWNFEYPDGQQSFRQTYAYRTQTSPLRASVGAAYDTSLGRGRSTACTESTFAAGATVTYTRWSSYVNRHRQAPLDPWLDTLSGAIGARWRGEVHRVGLDVTYEPSPVPDQVGRTNYVDNDRLGGALAYGLTWSLANVALETGLHVQVHRLLPRSVSKSTRATHPILDEFPSAVDGRTGDPIDASAGLQTNNPGYPGFSSEGWILGGGLSLTARFGKEGGRDE